MAPESYRVRVNLGNEYLITNDSELQLPRLERKPAILIVFDLISW